MTHICVNKFTIIASDNGLSPGRRQAIIWNNAGILSIGLLGTNFSEIWIEILTFSFKKMRLKMSSVKWRPFCLGLNVLTNTWIYSKSHCQNKMIRISVWFHNGVSCSGNQIFKLNSVPWYQTFLDVSKQPSVNQRPCYKILVNEHYSLVKNIYVKFMFGNKDYLTNS